MMKPVDSRVVVHCFWDTLYLPKRHSLRTTQYKRWNSMSKTAMLSFSTNLPDVRIYIMCAY